ncbi:hypothetical protein [Bacillus sp. THAF10]|uniref:hypothetical protein n=1 Tax=Bacillus sp. THAF10 TaxID=2587848 RepID=UPI0012697155|nr:hypothetical protein [Bacillus sp. THAF10]
MTEYTTTTYDNRNSVTSIIDSEATRVKGYTYDEFGNTKEVGSSSFLNDVKFTGAVHDSSSGLFYMKAGVSEEQARLEIERVDQLIFK